MPGEREGAGMLHQLAQLSVGQLVIIAIVIFVLVNVIITYLAAAEIARIDARNRRRKL
jgi:hypothetical protein